jgi:hypothetical protein
MTFDGTCERGGGSNEHPRKLRRDPLVRRTQNAQGARSKETEFLGLTGACFGLWLCVLRSTGRPVSCELRYADPPPGVASQHVVLPWRVGIARGFVWFFALLAGMFRECRPLFAIRARGKPAEPLLGTKSHAGSTLLRSGPSNKCTDGMDGQTHWLAGPGTNSCIMNPWNSPLHNTPP